MGNMGPKRGGMQHGGTTETYFIEPPTLTDLTDKEGEEKALGSVNKPFEIDFQRLISKNLVQLVLP